MKTGMLLIVVFATLLVTQKPVTAQLSPLFYARSCPNLQALVRRVVQQAVFQEPRMAASLLRLFFHDCFVQGCDASILLDDTSSFTGEKTAVPNRNSVRGFEVIDNIKSAVENACPRTVSCADILALAARESVLALQGPAWSVPLGRRDSTIASLASANNDIPAPTSTLSQLISKFQAKGLSIQDLVATSGAHTIGLARCVTFRDRLYNFSNTGAPDPNLNRFFLANLQQQCSPSTSSDNSLSALDVRSPNRFDNSYFVNLQFNRGLLNSDQVLASTQNGVAQGLVSLYANRPFQFFRDFASAMVNMGNISPLTGSAGQIRTSCRVVN
ncbi:peroxidase P7-like [Selaginella moellendorffii]|uniref:peroxidase P7-like n=1 Tax=Selaginella moellendorffii TaxID=88036 RepID=UPI000D1D0B69|nr:peroxidase P7-like [Selaginella moellendorffii]|eukprot:XP_024519392.1 peroxidase P7-like [Selaginella moellendorffii]